MMQTFNRTKIIATVGPASSSRENIEALISAGVDVFRINFSHGKHTDYAAVIRHIRETARGLKTNTGILADLQGPKIRIGEVRNNRAELRVNHEIILTTRVCIGDAKKVHVNYDRLPREVGKGSRILLDDGKLELEVVSTNNKDQVTAKIIQGGILSSKKGINLPNAPLSIPCLTKKDLKDIDFALKQDVNWIALSFVRSASDINSLRKIIEKKKKQARIVAKIEKPEAIRNIDEIIRQSDAVMVARGDLGVEVPVEETPGIQKDIISRCIRASRPVITATQIMESMIENPYPTRAEVTDVANIVYDGADALMLSGETSVGKHPVKVVETMRKIIQEVEKDPSLYLSLDGNNKWEHVPLPGSDSFLSEVICYNACIIAMEVKARAIIAMTKSGYTAYIASSFRPRSRTFIFTDNPYLLNTLSLVWGVRAFFYDEFVSTDQTISDVKNILEAEGYVRKGDIVVNIASMPLHEKGRANMLKVSKV